MSKPRPLVLLDVDGVLADFVSWYLDLARRVTGREYDPALVTQWDVAAAIGLTAGESGRVTELLHRPEYVLAMRPLPGAVEGVAALREVADIHVATSPWPGHPTWASERAEWLRRHFRISHKDVTHTSAKHLLRGACLVDDKPEHCADYARHNPDRYAVLWDQPYNRAPEHGAHPSVVRVADWQRLTDIVRS